MVTVTRGQQPPGGYGPGVPSPSRIHNYWKGGTANYEADRAVADRIEAVFPQIRQMAADAQLFAARITGYAAAEEVRQFIALGHGLQPGARMHEIARSIQPAAACVYVDSDPYVTGELEDRFWNVSGVAVVNADPCDPALLAGPGLAGIIDLGRPACVLASAVPHYLPPARARAVVARYARRLAPGSFVSACVPQIPDDLQWKRVAGLYTPARIYRYTPPMLGRLLGGLELVPPGITTAGEFHPGWRVVGAPEAPAGVTCVIAAAGRKPAGCLRECGCPCGGRGQCGLCRLAGCPDRQPLTQVTVTGWSGWPGEEMITVQVPGAPEMGTDSSRL